MTDCLVRFLYGILCVFRCLQLLHAASLPLQEFEELITAGVRHTGLLAGTPDVSHLPHGSYPRIFESEHHVPDSYYPVGDTSRFDAFLNDARSNLDQSHATGYAHLPEPASSFSPSSEVRSSETRLGLVNGHLHGSTSSMTQFKDVRAVETPSTSIGARLNSASAGDEMPGPSHGLTLVQYPSELTISELTIAQRQTLLHYIRDDVFQAMGARKYVQTVKGPIVAPYENALTPDSFSKAVGNSFRKGARPWIWHFGGHRILLRQASPKSGEFELLNGFRVVDRNRIFFEVWLEKGEPGSQLFEYLGVIRLPGRRNLSPFKKETLGKSISAVQAYSVVGPSTILTKGLEHK